MKEATKRAASEALAQMLAVTAMLVIASFLFYWRWREHVTGERRTRSTAHTTVILRSRALARRPEGWMHAPITALRAHPSGLAPPAITAKPLRRC